MSNNRYQEIRKALAMGPTPGPWKVCPAYSGTFVKSERGAGYLAEVRHCRAAQDVKADAHLIAACDSDTIRALLAERDQLAAEIEALRAEVAEMREFRDKMANAIGNDQLRRFIEKHGEPVPLTARVQAAEARAERLAEALRRAHRWGGLGKGWDSGVALDLIAWIESGMHGELPPLPDYLAAALAQEDCNG